MEVIINKDGMYEGIYNDYYIIREYSPSTTESKEVWHDFGYNMVDTKPDFSADTLEELQTKIDN